MKLRFLCLLLIVLPAGLATAQDFDSVRAQADTIGFATSMTDMQAVVAACLTSEGEAISSRRTELGLSPGEPWIAAIMPHDDYLYAGPTDAHLLPGFKARRWILIGVCHACRRIGVRDRLIFDSHDAWLTAGDTVPVDTGLRRQLLEILGDEMAFTDDERQDAEHSVEAMLPWLRTARPDAEFVSILVPTMTWPRLVEVATNLGAALADICERENWIPGEDIGILVSADAVHYGCEGWGTRGGYHPFGCDERGHVAGIRQDITLAEATLAGPLTAHGPKSFSRMVWDPQHPEYPYKITWCGVYSVPFGLLCAEHWQTAMQRPPLYGHLLRYGDSVTDGRMDIPGTALGVTAPNTTEHWVGYPALGYTTDTMTSRK